MGRLGALFALALLAGSTAQEYDYDQASGMAMEEAMAAEEYQAMMAAEMGTGQFEQQGTYAMSEFDDTLYDMNMDFLSAPFAQGQGASESWEIDATTAPFYGTSGGASESATYTAAAANAANANAGDTTIVFSDPAYGGASSWCPTPGFPDHGDMKVLVGDTVATDAYFRHGDTLEYSCNEGYSLSPAAHRKMVCTHLEGWTPTARPQCRVVYHDQNDGHRVTESLFWQSEFDKDLAMGGPEVYDGRVTDLLWDYNTPGTVEERDKRMLKVSASKRAGGGGGSSSATARSSGGGGGFGDQAAIIDQIPAKEVEINIRVDGRSVVELNVNTQIPDQSLAPPTGGGNAAGTTGPATAVDPASAGSAGIGSAGLAKDTDEGEYEEELSQRESRRKERRQARRERRKERRQARKERRKDRRSSRRKARRAARMSGTSEPPSM